MKNFTPAFVLCILLGYVSNAQKFTLLPQAGLESFKTSVQFNNLPSFSPKDLQLAPRLGLRMDYAFKKIGGPYLGVATSRSSAAINFTNPENGIDVTSVSTGRMQLRLEAGYQISSKPFYFNKSGAAKKAAAAAVQKAAAVRSMYSRGSCTRYHSGGCGNSSSRVAPVSQIAADKGWYVAIQPSIGLAYIPAVKSTVSIQSMDPKGISYVAGNMSSAFVAGTGFEFGENTDRKFNVSIQYIKGIGNLNTRAVTTFSGSKATTTMLGSSVSGWNVSFGIPISLSKKKVLVKQMPVYQERKAIPSQHRCGQYSRYMQSI